ncbi:MAG: hypothetical protein H0T43_07360 [Solirubrobacterales bacterium]|nr:hypothetical protein [Solirubrobacterales bacterium]
MVVLLAGCGGDEEPAARDDRASDVERVQQRVSTHPRHSRCLSPLLPREAREPEPTRLT